MSFMQRALTHLTPNTLILRPLPSRKKAFDGPFRPHLILLLLADRVQLRVSLKRQNPSEWIRSELNEFNLLSLIFHGDETPPNPNLNCNRS